MVRECALPKRPRMRHVLLAPAYYARRVRLRHVCVALRHACVGKNESDGEKTIATTIGIHANRSGNNCSRFNAPVNHWTRLPLWQPPSVCIVFTNRIAVLFLLLFVLSHFFCTTVAIHNFKSMKYILLLSFYFDTKVGGFLFWNKRLINSKKILVIIL